MRLKCLKTNIINCLFKKPLCQNLHNFSTNNKPSKFISISKIDNTDNNEKSVIVKAYYIARHIDILKNTINLYTTNKHVYQSKSVNITINHALNQYICIYSFGSVVFFNIPEANHVEHLRTIKDIATFDTNNINQQSEKYQIIINENLNKPSEIKAEYVNIQRLDNSNITLVGTVMAQSVALDYYSYVVEDLLIKFDELKDKIDNKGFSNYKINVLKNFVTSNAQVLTSVLFKLGIFEGNDAAWDNADYNYTWESLRKDFEIDLRYKDLSLKLDMVNSNSRFFLERLKYEKTHLAEQVIVSLIFFEIVINIIFYVNK